MAIDTNKLHAILTAAQNPAFKKLIDDRTKKLEERAKIDAEIAELDQKIAGTIPPELLVLLAPPKSAEPVKTRKRKASAEEQPMTEKAETAETPEATPASVVAEEKAPAEVEAPAA